MNLLIIVLLIVGIFLLEYLGVKLLTISDQKTRQAKNQMKEKIQEIDELNQTLDDTLDQLEKLNKPLTKVAEYVDKFNKSVLK